MTRPVTNQEEDTQPMPVDDTMRKLYEINDTLEALAYQHGVPGTFDSEDDYDRWLNDLTHHVAEEMGINAPDDETEDDDGEVAESHIDYRAGLKITNEHGQGPTVVMPDEGANRAR